jgi:hypothetical protein
MAPQDAEVRQTNWSTTIASQTTKREPIDLEAVLVEDDATRHGREQLKQTADALAEAIAARRRPAAGDDDQGDDTEASSGGT